MSLRINTNVAAINAHRQLAETSSRMAASMEKLSSGYRINRAKDDVAGLSIANTFRMEVRSLKMAQQNVAQAISMLQVAEGGAAKIETIVERLKELATLAASDNTDANGRGRLDAEADDLISEIDRIAADTKYSATALLDGTATLVFQVGSGNTDEDQIEVKLDQAMDSTTTGLAIKTLNLKNLASAQAAITSLDEALVKVNTVLGTIGAAQSRLDFASANLAVTAENISASESTIRDADMAFEMTNFTKNQILMQAGTAMLAQANMAPQGILSLIGGR